MKWASDDRGLVGGEIVCFLALAPGTLILHIFHKNVRPFTHLIVWVYYFQEVPKIRVRAHLVYHLLVSLGKANH